MNIYYNVLKIANRQTHYYPSKRLFLLRIELMEVEIRNAVIRRYTYFVFNSTP